MNRHLNAFVPYAREAAHEDDLTRAAMIVVRYVPLARQALLELVGAPALPTLGPAEVDVQTAEVMHRGASAGPVQLFSVFLTPDETDPAAADVEVLLSDRRQRLDGVIRFDSGVAVVVESKIWEGADAWQAEHLNLFGAELLPGSAVKKIAWHDLLEAWRQLQDLGLLGPAEFLLLKDLFDFGGEFFPQLMPFRKLRQARGHPARMARFVRKLLQDATGITPADRDNYVLLDEALGTRCVQRAYCHEYEGGVSISLHPGENKKQAQWFYSAGRATRFAALDNDGASDEWYVFPNLRLGFLHARYDQQLRTTLSGSVSAAEYASRWTGDLEWLGAYSAEEASSELWPWLLEQGYASPEDAFEPFLERVGQRKVFVNAAMGVERYWTWETAERLDDADRLSDEIRQAINTVLAALDEPTLQAPRHAEE